MEQPAQPSEIEVPNKGILSRLVNYKFKSFAQHVNSYTGTNGTDYQALNLGSVYLLRSVAPDGQRGPASVDIDRTTFTQVWNEKISQNTAGEWVYVFHEDGDDLREGLLPGDKVGRLHRGRFLAKVLLGNPRWLGK